MHVVKGQRYSAGFAQIVGPDIRPVKLAELHRRLALLWRIVLATTIVAAALLLRWLLLPADAGSPVFTFYPAVVIAFYLCGTGPGYLAVGLSTVAAYFFFIRSVGGFGSGLAGDYSLASFLVTASVVGQIIARMQRATARAQVLFDSSPTAMLAIAPDTGKIQATNLAAQVMWGYQHDELQTKTVADLIHPVDAPALRELYEQLVNGGSDRLHFEKRFRKKDGALFWAASSISIVRDSDGRPQFFIGSAVDVTERKVLAQELAAASAEIEDLYDNAPCGYHSLGADGTIKRINNTELAWLGYTREEVIGKMKAVDLFDAAGRELFRQRYPQFMRDGHIEDLEFDLLSRDGARRHVLLSATAIRDKNGKFLMSRSVMFDMSELHKAKLALQKLTSEQQAMLDNELVGIVKARDRRIQWANRAMQRISGYDQVELLGRDMSLLFPDESSFQLLDAEIETAMKDMGRFRAQVVILRSGGEKSWVDLNITQLSGSSAESMWMVVDIAEMMKRREEIEHLVYHDFLTGLPNRLLFVDRLQQQMTHAVRSGEPLAVCFVDLDDFKQVNDTYGHAAGDRLLVETAARMQSCVRANDTVCRLGGDEFALLLCGLKHVDEYEEILQRVMRVVNQPYALGDGQEARVRLSIGVTLYPPDNADCDDLMKHADAAMYQAKQLGRNRICVYGASVAPDVNSFRQGDRRTLQNPASVPGLSPTAQVTIDAPSKEAEYAHGSGDMGM